MKNHIPSEITNGAGTLTLAIAVSAFLAGLTGTLGAQAPDPAVHGFAAGLLAPSKLIRTPLDNFEAGPEVPNNGRVTIVDAQERRRTLLDGLPSARTFVGDFNGTTGVWLEGRTLYILNGQGDTLAGPVPGKERVNPGPASPIFSSVLVGPPIIENVPTSIRWAGDQLQVTLQSGAPFFLPGFSQVQQVDPRTGVVSRLITGLSSAIDTIALGSRGRDEGDLTFEHNLTFPAPGVGRLPSVRAMHSIP